MLQKFHDKIKGWVASVIVGILCLAFALWGVQYYVGGGDASGKVLAKIGTKQITLNEVDNLYRQMQRQVEGRGVNTDSTVNSQLKAQALNQIMLQTLLSEAATKEGFVVTQSQIKQVILSIPNFQENGQFSPKLFQQFLFNAGLTEQVYFHELQTEMLISQVANSIEGSTFVLPDEIEDFYNLFMQKRNFGYMIVSAHQFVPQIKLTDAEIKQYYANNKDKFREPEKVSIQYIELSPATVAHSVKLNPAELKQYYQDHLANYRVAHTPTKTKSFAEVEPQIKQMLTQEKTERLIANLNEKLSNLTFTNPDTLEPAAKELGVALNISEPFSLEGKVTTGIAANPDVVKAAFSKDVLQQGNNSNPIILKDGSVIVLRVKQRIPSKLIPLAEVGPKVQLELLGKMADAKAALLANQLESEINQGKDPAQLAAKNHLSWVEQLDIQRNNKAVDKSLLKAVFDMTPAELNKAITVSEAQGDAIVVYLQKITKPNFSAATSQEKEQLAQQLKSMMAQLTYRLYVLHAKTSVKQKIYEQNFKSLQQ